VELKLRLRTKFNGRNIFLFSEKLVWQYLQIVFVTYAKHVAHTKSNTKCPTLGMSTPSGSPSGNSGISVEMVENQRNLCRLPYLDNNILLPS